MHTPTGRLKRVKTHKLFSFMLCNLLNFSLRPYLLFFLMLRNELQYEGFENDISEGLRV